MPLSLSFPIYQRDENGQSGIIVRMREKHKMSTVPGTVGLGEWSPLIVIPARGREGKGGGAWDCDLRKWVKKTK